MQKNREENLNRSNLILTLRLCKRCQLEWFVWLLVCRDGWLSHIPNFRWRCVSVCHRCRRWSIDIGVLRVFQVRTRGCSRTSSIFPKSWFRLDQNRPRLFPHDHHWKKQNRQAKNQKFVCIECNFWCISLCMCVFCISLISLNSFVVYIEKTKQSIKFSWLQQKCSTKRNTEKICDLTYRFL